MYNQVDFSFPTMSVKPLFQAYFVGMPQHSLHSFPYLSIKILHFFFFIFLILFSGCSLSSAWNFVEVKTSCEYQTAITT